MNFSEKLRGMRKQAGLSQEQLAERLNVSRQAITKWEVGGGMPDIDNLIAIAKFFGITMDELAGGEGKSSPPPDFFYESVTEYDVSAPRNYDIHIGGAKEIALTVSDNEKVRLRLASNTLKTLESSFKVKLDEHDIYIRRAETVPEAKAKEALYVFISLPKRFLAHTELEAIAGTLRIHGFNGETLEFDGKISRVFVEQSSANIELNSATDLEIDYDRFSGRLELNLMSTTAKLNIPLNSGYCAATKGHSNSISFTKDDQPWEKEPSGGAENKIELRGFHAELIVNEVSSVRGGCHE